MVPSGAPAGIPFSNRILSEYTQWSSQGLAFPSRCSQERTGECWETTGTTATRAGTCKTYCRRRWWWVLDSPGVLYVWPTHIASQFCNFYSTWTVKAIASNRWQPSEFSECNNVPLIFIAILDSSSHGCTQALLSLESSCNLVFWYCDIVKHLSTVHSCETADKMVQVARLWIWLSRQTSLGNQCLAWHVPMARNSCGILWALMKQGLHNQILVARSIVCSLVPAHNKFVNLSSIAC